MPIDLKQATSATIYVKMVHHTSGWQSQFSTDNDNWHTPPIKWEPAKGSKTPLSITFKLENNVEKLTTSSSNITLGTASNGEQTASVKAVKAGDSFKVVRPTGESHDPQIVVTPLT